MLNIAIFDKNDTKKPGITEILREAADKKALPIRSLYPAAPEKILLNPERLNIVDVFIFSSASVTDSQIEYAKKIRGARDRAYIVFVTNMTRNIQSLVRPSVSPSGILFIPLEKAAVYQTINEIYAESISSGKNGSGLYTIKSGGEYYRVPLNRVLYFQAREKRVALATEKQEILFYGSISGIMSELPGNFTRCYKSFIVNTDYIFSVDVNRMEINLTNHFKIPLSRLYKSEFKRFIQGAEFDE